MNWKDKWIGSADPSRCHHLTYIEWRPDEGSSTWQCAECGATENLPRITHSVIALNPDRPPEGIRIGSGPDA